MVRLCTPIVALIALSAVAAAQAPATSPRISIVQRGADRLLEDTQRMMSLTPEGREQWETVKEFFEEIFLYGVDRKRPIRIDLVIGNGPTRYVPSFPVGNDDEFLENLENFGIENRRKGTGYYELSDAFEGFLRIKDGYGSIAEEAYQGDIPASMPDPVEAIAKLIKADYDLAAELVNGDTSEAARTTRLETFHKNVFEELLAAVVRREKESKEEFDLRKLGIEQQLADFERYYADTAEARIGWSADVTKDEGTVDVLLKPIAKSELAAAVGLLNAKPNHFANVEARENAILSLRVNHPLDDLRKKHFADFYALLRPVLKSRIDDETEKTDAEKTARKKLVDMIVDMLDSGAQAGVAEGFAEVYTDQLSHTAVAGIRSPNGKAADAIVKLLPASNKKITVKEAVAKMGDVTVHEVTVPANELPGLQYLFGKSDTILVGTSPQVVWFAAGPGAKSALEAAVTAVGKKNEGKAGDPFVALDMKIRPWLEVRARGTQAESGDPELRKIVMDALGTSDDSLHLELTRVEDRVQGKLLVKEGVFRIVGRMMAKFSKDNLEAE